MASPPFVVLLGWLGSRYRYLSKFSNWYSDQGAETLCYIPPVYFIATPEDAARRCRAVLDDVAAKSKGRPVFVHMFSNTGFLQYGLMLREMQSQTASDAWQDIVPSTVGLMYDSCPATFTVELATRGYVGAALGAAARFGMASRGDLRYEHEYLTPVARHTFNWLFNHLQLREIIFELENVLETQVPDCPQLYLYGDEDDLITSAEIEEYMAVQLQQPGRQPIFKCRWPDSGHVEHFRQHPAEYQRTVLYFMRTCLANRTMSLRAEE